MALDQYDKKHVRYGGRLVIVGFGSIGQGVLPLILRHIDMPKERISIVTAEPRGREVAAEYGIAFAETALTRDNYRDVLTPLLGPGDFLLNLSVDVQSVALIEFANARGAFYLDTCIEPWPGGYTDPSLTPSQRSNYALRESARALRAKFAGGPTAVLTHGANPGLVSHFVKQALLDIARDTGRKPATAPKDRAGWAALARDLGVKVIHIAERDTQVATFPKKVGEFVNTWSIDGFVGEGSQPAELGWGSHERTFPADGKRHEFGCDAAIYLMRPGAGTRVRSWTPLEGPYHGFLVTHNESISIADYYTVAEGAAVKYRPTVHYAYHPCDDAVLSLHELAGKGWKMQPAKRLMVDEIASGMDELGVLLMGHAKGAYWYGSRLTIEEARKLVPHNNATSLQVTVAVLAGIVWAIENPKAGPVEADEMDHARCMDVCRPYLGEVVGVYSDWTPLSDRERLFPEKLVRDDPWQFDNFRVA
jgi:homospermidine synthase